MLVKSYQDAHTGERLEPIKTDIGWTYKGKDSVGYRIEPVSTPEKASNALFDSYCDSVWAICAIEWAETL